MTWGAQLTRQACLGGYLLQENFTNGFPGHEKAYRAAMLNAIGQEKYDFFWSKFYEYCESALGCCSAKVWAARLTRSL